VELIEPDRLVARATQLAAQNLKVAILSRGESLAALPESVVVIALPNDDAELAHMLYAALRRVDELGCNVALATLPIEQGIGVAVADRLRKAAGPRAVS
jgi:L-threonylcarbamoyladenylate synthase